MTDLDRVAGALVGLAAGDALGAGYEFTTPAADAPITMEGGGGPGWAPGEWTDDTAQAVGIAQVLAAGDLARGGPRPGGHGLVAIGQRFLDWAADEPKDIGIQTHAVLSAAGTAADLPRAAADHFARTPRGAAGNGSLMRTAPVALARLGDDRAIADLAMAVSAVTHGDPLAGEACVLWCIAIDRAVREGRLDGVWDGLAVLPDGRAAFWRDRLDEAESRPPGSFTPNGFVVTALQAAHAAITQTPIPTDEPCRHLQDALVAAVRIGHDTDTVAAIAGQVLGARWGASAVPWRWRRLLHGWPGLDVRDLARLGVLASTGGAADAIGWPSGATTSDHAARYEAQVWCGPLTLGGGVSGGALLVGNQPGLAAALEQGVDAVVSLCRMGTDEVPEGVEHHHVRLVDKAGDEHNPNLPFVIADTVQALQTLREEGKRVFLHCQGGRSRTAAIACAYLAAEQGGAPADHLAAVQAVLPQAHLRVFGPVL